MIRILPLLCLLVACGGKDEPHADEPLSFPEPWLDAEPSNQTISGAFDAELGSALPGAGWFESGPATGRDASRAAMVDEGGTWPVVRIELFGWAGSDWDRVELDISRADWVAGDVPLDGESAVGRLTTADGEVRYLLGGSLHITGPGQVDGDRVSGWFTDVPLTGAAR